MSFGSNLGGATAAIIPLCAVCPFAVSGGQIDRVGSNSSGLQPMATQRLIHRNLRFRRRRKP
jgi:hypothetical protein